MAIKFETASGPQAKPSEKRAEAARTHVDEKEKNSDEASPEAGEGDKGSPKKIKQRSSFKKK